MTRDSKFFCFYRSILLPLLLAAFRAAGLFNAKIREGLRMRAGDETGTPPWLKAPAGQRPVWIHCASGEFEYAKPVITLLKKRAPGVRILVTYFSPSIAGAVGKFPGVDIATPAPWDRASDVSRFIEHHRPRALLIARTDAWPEMVRQAEKHAIPSLLFSATLAAGSGRATGFGRWASRAVFSKLTEIYCVSEADRAVFEGLRIAPRTVVAGDTRYDQVRARLATPKPLREALFSGVDPLATVVCGSTWEEDEAVLVETIAATLDTSLRFVIVPHEPTDAHLASLEEALRGKGLASMRYSKSETWPAGTVLLVDQIGILAELYAKARLAFVGGSFRKTVHSVMEPLAAGCFTFVGPLHHNNREALEFKTLAMVQEATDAGELAQKLKAAATRLKAEPKLSESVRDEVHKRGGKSEAVLAWLEARGLLS